MEKYHKYRVCLMKRGKSSEEGPVKLTDNVKQRKQETIENCQTPAQAKKKTTKKTVRVLTPR